MGHIDIDSTLRIEKRKTFTEKKAEIEEEKKYGEVDDATRLTPARHHGGRPGGIRHGARQVHAWERRKRSFEAGGVHAHQSSRSRRADEENRHQDAKHGKKPRRGRRRQGTRAEKARRPGPAARMTFRA